MKELSQEELKERWLDVGRNYIKLGPSKLARKWGVSRQCIAQMACRLRKQGVDIPKLSPGYSNKDRVAFREALEELKKRK